MSLHNCPRHNAIMRILKSGDAPDEIKKKIEKLNKAFKFKN